MSHATAHSHKVIFVQKIFGLAEDLNQGPFLFSEMENGCIMNDKFPYSISLAVNKAYTAIGLFIFVYYRNKGRFILDISVS